ncbi:MAG: PQQ-binding-like beta-propeller repeat protein [Phycisphaera sp.]|nr:PQQ-binding-like beta-propeller repeat protein [Phycisphaera sp.]
MHLHRLSAAIAALCVVSATAVFAGDWSNWRGPEYNGATDATGLPATFSKTENVKWVVDLPGPSAATPIIHGDRVFISSATDPQTAKLLAMCFDRKTGKLLWSNQVGSGYQLDDKSNYASPSPVTDGKVVVFFYGNGALAGFDMDGKQLWARNLQEDYGDFTFQWTFSSSPTLYQGALYMQVLQRDQPVHGHGKDGQESYLLKLDPMTGKTLIQHVRPSDAQMESRESYGTPIPYEGAGRKEIIIVGGDYLTGYDPDTLNELWRWGTWNPGHREQWWRHVPSTVIGDGVALVCAPKKAPVYAVKMGLKGDTSYEDGLVWKSADKSTVTSDVPTPLFTGGKFFVLSDLTKRLTRIAPKTGAVEWEIEMPGRYKWRSSPTYADSRIYCMNHHGDVVVIDPENGKILHEAAMGDNDDDNIRASVSIASGCLFVRTNSKLYCIGK